MIDLFIVIINLFPYTHVVDLEHTYESYNLALYNVFYSYTRPERDERHDEGQHDQHAAHGGHWRLDQLRLLRLPHQYVCAALAALFAAFCMRLTFLFVSMFIQIQSIRRVITFIGDVHMICIN